MTGLGELPRETALGQHLPEGLGPGPGLPGGDDEGAAARDLADRLRVAGDHGQARGHGLGHRARQALVPAGHREDVQPGQQLGHVVTVPGAQEAAAAAGRQVFETEACVNCHTISGTAAKGVFGPDLTHLMSRSTIASGAADNTPQNLRAWIENPNTCKPGALMPAMQLNDQQTDEVVAYLETLH